MADIFVSYASQERRKVAALVDRLEEAGVSVWWDQYLHQGAFFDRVINHELRRAKAVIVVWSASAFDSQWVLAEALHGFEHGKLISTKLEDCEIPVPFNTLQSVPIQSASNEWRAIVDGMLRDVAVDTTSYIPADPQKPSNEVPHVAVLPFACADGENQLGEDLASEVASALSRFSSIQVLSTRSTFLPDLARRSTREIAQSLDVQYIVTGSVRQGSDRVSARTVLLDAATERQIWSETASAQENAYPSVFVSVAESICRKLGGEFLRSDILNAGTHISRRQDVWQLIQQGKSHLISFDPEALEKSRQLLRQALQISPEDPYALSIYASVLSELIWYTDDNKIDGVRKEARQVCDRARTVSDRDPVVLKYTGMVMANLGQVDLGIKILRESYRANPYDLGTWGYLAGALIATTADDAIREALELLEFALAEAPNHPGVGFWHLHRAHALSLLGQHSDSLDAALEVIVHQPSMSAAYLCLANCQAELGQFDAARESLRQASSLVGAISPDQYIQRLQTISSLQSFEARTCGLRRLLDIG